MGGAHYANVNRDLLMSADALDHPLLQETQQLGLQRQRHVADLVEEQRAVVGVLDLSASLFGCTRESPLLVPEELALEQRIRNRSTVDRDEWPGGPGAQRVKRPCEQLLARTALAQEQYRGVGRRDLLHQPADLQHALAGRDHALERRGVLAKQKLAVLILELIHPIGALDDERKDVGIDRLLIEIVGTEADRFDSILAVAAPGDYDHLGMGCDLEDLR